MKPIPSYIYIYSLPLICKSSGMKWKVKQLSKRSWFGSREGEGKGTKDKGGGDAKTKGRLGLHLISNQ